MNTLYSAPVQDIMAALMGAGELQGWHGELAAEDVNGILDEAGRFAGNVIAPLNASGDREGIRVVDGRVHCAQGFAQAWQQFSGAGWPALAQPCAYGGHGMPATVHAAVAELWAGANLAFATCPELAVGAVLALEHHGSEALRQAFLPGLIDGSFTATMCLSEPAAGSDLGAIRTTAQPAGDHFLLRGRKLFITWGDHDLTEQIVHLVLARLPDAPAGSRGLSMFLMPAVLEEGDSAGLRNDIELIGTESKMGLHASPTCALALGPNHGAVAHLVGEPHAGLACMFTMMNHMRLGVGVQANGVAARATSAAALWAQERVQGRTPENAASKAIIGHADVARMLADMQTLTQAGRSLALMAARRIDEADAGNAAAAAQAALLTPVVKAWCSDMAEAVCSMAIQIHGGMGYVEETGVAQLYRDVRVTSIYEGTNGIQALDFLRRRVLADEGHALGSLFADIDGWLQDQGVPERWRSAVSDALEELRATAGLAIRAVGRDGLDPGWIAVDLLRQCGELVAAALLVRNACVAVQGVAQPPHYQQQRAAALADWGLQLLLPRSAAYARRIRLVCESSGQSESIRWLTEAPA
ncbi:MAG: acyl-CoA dehydrogenase family protein [Gammaproteobacteria bacterium]|nr:acyl-CoA dehydrogenase family protein [Gammaproteobacteria bacterium]